MWLALMSWTNEDANDGNKDDVSADDNDDGMKMWMKMKLVDVNVVDGFDDDRERFGAKWEDVE